MGFTSQFLVDPWELSRFVPQVGCALLSGGDKSNGKYVKRVRDSPTAAHVYAFHYNADEKLSYSRYEIKGYNCRTNANSWSPY